MLATCLRNAETVLKNAQISTYSLDAEILLSTALNRTREFLYAHPEYTMTDGETVQYAGFIKRRSMREPVAYITHKREFYGLEFFVDKRVLIPRPETEKIVESALNQLSVSHERCMVVDVGTGSGCIIIAIAKSSDIPDRYLATDLYRDTLEVALANASRHGVEKQIAFFQGNLIEPILNLPQHHFDTIIITANLPYITPSHYQTLQPEIVQYEPKTALLTPHNNALYYYEKINSQIELLKKITNATVYTHYELPS
jgi:release factor glutamine methyltransferase